MPLLEDALPLELVLLELPDLLPELLLEAVLDDPVEPPLELLLPLEVVALDPLLLTPVLPLLPVPPEVPVLVPPFSGVELLQATRARAAASDIRHRIDEVMGSPQENAAA